MDGDKIFTAQFRHMLTSAGVDVRRITANMPWQNGYIERFVQTIKYLILRKVFCLSVEALREAVLVGIRHYNTERPHQSLGNLLIVPAATPPDIAKPIVRIDHLGGVIHHYVRAA